MSVAFDPVNPRRSAHASIYGYLYQTCLGVLRWLNLDDNEVLVCEGDEDLDRLITHGVGVCEQVKALQGAVSIRDRVVTESVRQFLLTYVAIRQRGDARRFVFTTTARCARQRGEVDVLASWHDASAHPAVIAALRELLPPEKDGDVRQAVVDALAWLDREDGWITFLNSVEWRFEEPDLDRVRAEIADRLAADSVARRLPGENLINRLVAELLDASRQPKQSSECDRERISKDSSRRWRASSLSGQRRHGQRASKRCSRSSTACGISSTPGRGI